MRNIVLAVVLLSAGQAMAQPWEMPAEGLPAPSEHAPFPDCGDRFLDANGIPTLPYARDPRVYGRIYLAVERRFAPLARYFFPVLQVDDQKNWVWITRITRDGARPPQYLTVAGRAHFLLDETGTVPVRMKIDKCTGAVLEMSFDKNKVR